MMDFIVVLKFSLCFILPFLLLLHKKYNLLLLWLCVSVCIETFNIQYIVNISPLESFGLIYSPFFFWTFMTNVRWYIKLSTIRYLIIYFLLLVSIGLIFGLLFPWQDKTGMRWINQQPEGRYVINSVRMMCEMSFSFFILQSIRNTKDIKKIIVYLICGTTVASVGVLLQYFLSFDIFTVFDNSVIIDYQEYKRMRGFNGEPRSSGLVIVYGLFFIMLNLEFNLKKISLLIIHGLALLLCVSKTGLFLLVTGALILPVVSSMKYKMYVLSWYIAIVCFLLFSLSFLPDDYSLLWENAVNRYLQMSIYDKSQEPAYIQISKYFEVFDASYVRFIFNNINYLYMGVGPGLISIPASDYIPPEGQLIYGNRIDSVPHTGILLILSNGGVLGLILCLMIVYRCIYCIDKTRRIPLPIESREIWERMKIQMWLFSILYFMQATEIVFIVISLSIYAEKLYTEYNSSEKIID